MTRLFFDVECYPNYFLIVFSTEENKIVCFELDENKTFDKRKVLNLLSSYETVGFNSRSYDIPMILKAINLLSGDLTANDSLKKLSDELIENDTFDILSKYNLWCPKEFKHIDIINVIAGKASLKMYGARVHTEFLQDLPYEPNRILTDKEKEEIKKYCINDINITKQLYKKIEPEIEIRKKLSAKYDIDLCSKSDAQIAEALFRKTLCTYTPSINDFDFNYEKPSYINFKNQELKSFENKICNVNFKGKIGDQISKDDIVGKIKINNNEYKIGIGGLHSTEKNISFFSDKDIFLIDYDVSSYYPSIILNNNIYPQGLNDSFLKTYQKWYEDRLLAKSKKDENLSWVLKIVLNGAFGKFNSKFSVLYCPRSLIQTTITGQLSLLMLIEKLEEHGFNVVSANTDGITVKGKKTEYSNLTKIIDNWQLITKFKLEEVRYKSIHIKSVNNYIAIKEDNSLKLKGVFAKDNLSKNPTIGVCKKAIINYLLKGIKIEDSIYNEEIDPKEFVMVRKSKYGAYYNNEYLGKVVRWYWANEGLLILDEKGNKVADSDDARPIMNLNQEMFNINYDKYIKKSYELLESLGL